MFDYTELIWPVAGTIMAISIVIAVIRCILHKCFRSSSYDLPDIQQLEMTARSEPEVPELELRSITSDSEMTARSVPEVPELDLRSIESDSEMTARSVPDDVPELDLRSITSDSYVLETPIRQIPASV